VPEKPLTNHHISQTHAANCRAEMQRAGTIGELKDAAARHAPYLLAADSASLRPVYADRLAQLKGLK
jgi:hypothetical protein